MYKRPDTWTSSLLDTSSRLPPYIPVPGREGSVTFNTGSCTQPTRHCSVTNLPADWNPQGRQPRKRTWHDNKKLSDGISNRHRFAVMVYLSPLVHPEAVNVGVQDHLQYVQDCLQGPGFGVTSKNGIIRLKMSQTSTIFM